MISEEEAHQKYEEIMKTMVASKDESDRGIVIIIASHIEDCLRRLIEAFLIDSNEVKVLFEGPYAPLGSLSGKAKAAYLMGLIKKSELERIEAVRKVRNVFAHEINADFSHPDIAKICSKPPVFDGRLCDRDAFLHMAQNTVFPILYRDIPVRKTDKRRELPESAR